MTKEISTEVGILRDESGYPLWVSGENTGIHPSQSSMFFAVPLSLLALSHSYGDISPCDPLAAKGSWASLQSHLRRVCVECSSNNFGLKIASLVRKEERRMRWHDSLAGSGVVAVVDSWDAFRWYLRVLPIVEPRFRIFSVRQ